MTVANGEKASSTHAGFVDVSGLPTAARNAHVIPGIKHSLLSIVRLCNAGCGVIFDKWGVSVEVRYNGKILMKGGKSMINGLCYVPITQNSEVNPDKHTEPEKETANSATDANVKFQFTKTEELNTAEHQNYIEDEKMTVKTANKSRFKQFVANFTTPTSTFSQAELAMYHHQSLGNPRKDTILRALRKHPTQLRPSQA